MAKGNVELWLGELLKEQQMSLHHIIREAAYLISESGFEIQNFVEGAPAQVGLYFLHFIRQ